MYLSLQCHCNRTLQDNGSATGTYLNGKLLKPNLPYRLQDGFIIFLGYPSTSNSAFLFRTKMQNIQKFQANCSGNGESLESPNSLSRPESMSDPQVLDHTDCSARPSFIVILNGREGNNRSNSEASIPRILAHDEENLAIIEEDNSSETKQKTDMNEPIEDPFKLPCLLARRKLLERQKELEKVLVEEVSGCRSVVVQKDPSQFGSQFEPLRSDQFTQSTQDVHIVICYVLQG
ncbi:hypothetical protein TNCV_3286191 [Trichonephila clavipes]|nr:hypothetical protein TNCV_3286191 [Trichonephila clavipes]